MRSEHGITPTDYESTDLVIDRVIGQEEVALLAYFYCETRGCPHNSPHEDWFRAEAELRHRLSAAATD